MSADTFVDWRERAACLPHADIFTAPRTSRQVATAKALCARCPVRAQCDASIVVTPSFAPDRIVQAGHYWIKGRRSRRFVAVAS